jgi:hypothetical protein
VPPIAIKLNVLGFILLFSLVVGVIAALLQHADGGSLVGCIAYGGSATLATGGVLLVAAKWLIL